MKYQRREILANEENGKIVKLAEVIENSKDDSIRMYKATGEIRTTE